MTLLRAYHLAVALLSAGILSAGAQQAVSPTEHVRLVEQLPNSPRANIDANGSLTAENDYASDDGFGEAVVLQNQSPNHAFVLSGDTSVFYTSNAALTPNHEIDDVFFVADAAITWTPITTPHFGAQFIAHGSTFRYDQHSVLDFQSFGAGVGLTWNLDELPGISFFARYDFIDMLDRHSEQILRDHEFSVGAQKGFTLGRAQTLVIGAYLMAGLAEPESAQRDQGGLFLAYRLQMSRSLAAELGYRFAGYYYNESERVDRGQVLSANLQWRVLEWIDINASVSLISNGSDDPAFDYSAVTGGGGLSAHVQF